MNKLITKKLNKNKYSQKELDILVKDLVRLGDFSSWEAPIQPSNLKWFNENTNGDIYRNIILTAKRLEELVQLGADLTKHAYLIANINCPEILKIALKYGANPNLPGSNGILPIDRAIPRGRSSIAKLLINNQQFNFLSQESSNVLLLSLKYGKYKFAIDIANKRPNLIMTKNHEGSTPLIILSQFLHKNFSKKEKITSKIISFVNIVYDYYLKQNNYINIHEINNLGQSIITLSPQLALFISEKNAKSLKEKLDNNLTNQNYKHNKI